MFYVCISHFYFCLVGTLAAGRFGPKGRGSRTVEYSASVSIAAGTSSSVSSSWGPAEGLFSTKSPERPGWLAPAIHLALTEYACGVHGGRIICYAPLSRKCVVLRQGRIDRPAAALVRPGGHTMYPVCRGAEVLEEVEAP